VKMSMQRYGAKDKAKEEQYELLVEDQIEFISHELLKGIVGIVVLICSSDILYCSNISVDHNVTIFVTVIKPILVVCSVHCILCIFRSVLSCALAFYCNIFSALFRFKLCYITTVSTFSAHSTYR
jgi:ABC-type transport system involved in cytochrome bd biosynthesis fused ATPase/permease subunit